MSNSVQDNQPPPARLETGGGHFIAYHQTIATTKPSTPIQGVVFLGGFMSDMTSSKALFMEAFCAKLGISFTRFDYYGHGQSSGSFEEGTIGRWKQDALAVIDKLTEGKLLLVGSSLGGWIMLLAALERPERVGALIGIAPAPDFTEELIWDTFTPEQKEQLAKLGKVMMPSEYCNDPSGHNDYPITTRLIEEAREHLLLKRPSIPLTQPTWLLHGVMDQDVPCNVSLRLAEKLSSENVTMVLQKNGTHRMSTPESLTLLANCVTQALSVS